MDERLERRFTMENSITGRVVKEIRTPGPVIQPLELQAGMESTFGVEDDNEHRVQGSKGVIESVLKKSESRLVFVLKHIVNLAMYLGVEKSKLFHIPD